MFFSYGSVKVPVLPQHKQLCRMFLSFRNGYDILAQASLPVSSITAAGTACVAVCTGQPRRLIILSESQRAFCRFALNCRKYQMFPTFYRLKHLMECQRPKASRRMVISAREPICYLGYSYTNYCRVVLKFNIVLCILSRKNSLEKTCGIKKLL